MRSVTLHPHGVSSDLPHVRMQRVFSLNSKVSSDLAAVAFGWPLGGPEASYFRVPCVPGHRLRARALDQVIEIRVVQRTGLQAPVKAQRGQLATECPVVLARPSRSIQLLC